MKLSKILQECGIDVKRCGFSDKEKKILDLEVKVITDGEAERGVEWAHIEDGFRHKDNPCVLIDITDYDGEES